MRTLFLFQKKQNMYSKSQRGYQENILTYFSIHCLILIISFR